MSQLKTNHRLANSNSRPLLFNIVNNTEMENSVTREVANYYRKTDEQTHRPTDGQIKIIYNLHQKPFQMVYNEMALLKNKHKVICEQRLYINLCTQMKTILTGLPMYAY